MSNSSSSSFLILGNWRESNRPLRAKDYESLKDGEAYLVVVDHIANEGSYIVNLPLERLMDCDMHQIDIKKSDYMRVAKAKYLILGDGRVIPASKWLQEDDFHIEDEVACYSMIREGGLPVSGTKLLYVNKDWDNPSDWRRCMEVLEDVKQIQKRQTKVNS